MQTYQIPNDPKLLEKFVRENAQSLMHYKNNVKGLTAKMTLSQWNETMIYPYDVEAKEKGWVTTQFQDTLGTIWDMCPRSMVWAPREHLKTHTALSYILKRVYERQYPLEINYYHISGSLANEKFRKMQRIVENNPLLADNFDIKNAKSWSEETMELSDGTLIVPWSYQSGSVGKHPHIIVLDDIIDYHVIYSDLLNEKAITSFYTNIYPQLSKDDPSKRIIMIGTAQRKNDIYNSLPADFKKFRYSAIVDDARKQVLSPEIFTYERLMQIKSDISQHQGDRYWQKEYMNIPFESSGLVIRPQWIQYFNEISTDLWPFLQVYQGWDLSVGKDIEKGDWTVCATIAIDRREQGVVGGKIKIYVLDIYRARIDFGVRLKSVKTQSVLHTPRLIGIESVAFQYDTIQQARTTYGLPIMEVRAIINKVQSFQVELSPYFENAQVYIKANQHWTDLFVNEMLSLPVGEYDDQADALKIAIKTGMAGAGGPLPDQALGETKSGEANYEPPIFSDLDIGGTMF